MVDARGPTPTRRRLAAAERRFLRLDSTVTTKGDEAIEADTYRVRDELPAA
jgi:hypothetical protein